jgi:LmbE family N-acetylglucosaminyl deacetylase
VTPPQSLRLLAVLAHPDDESLGFGGALARYASEGVEVSLITATSGQGGRFQGIRPGEPGHPGSQALGRIREDELRRAAAVLGVQDVTLLGHPDGLLDQVEPRDAMGAIAHHLRRLRPQVVLTFSPDGAYGHPDHIAISQFTTAAIVVAADPAASLSGEELPPHAVSKLYYMVGTREEKAAYEAAFRRLTIMVDGVERHSVVWPDWAVTTVLDTRAYQAAVWKAAQCHESQISGYEGLKSLPADQIEALWGRLHFYRALSTVSGGRQLETDLFEGLRTT